MIDRSSIDSVLAGIYRSRALLLLLTEGALRRPSTLLQVYEAIRLHRPIVCVEVQGGGYSHAAAKEWLRELKANLAKTDPKGFEQMRHTLHARGHTLQQLELALYNVLPSIIAINFTPSGTHNHADAVMVDICERMVYEDRRAKRGAFAKRHSSAASINFEESLRESSCERETSTQRIETV